MKFIVFFINYSSSIIKYFLKIEENKYNLQNISLDLPNKKKTVLNLFSNMN